MDSTGTSSLEMIVNCEAASTSGSNSTNPGNTNFQNSQPWDSTQRATDLLISVSVTADLNREKIFNLAYKAAQELQQMATEGVPLWKYDNDQETDVLDKVQYEQRFGTLDATLEEIITLILSGQSIEELPKSNPISADIMGNEIQLKREASRATGLVSRNPIDLVNMLMDAVQWSYVFPNIVSNATVLGVLSTGRGGNPDGALQVMKAEFHLPSPLLPTREICFSRYCRQLSQSTWVVVDVSLESIFQQPITRFQRRPSGCFIQALGDRNSRISWIEHNYIDNSNVPSMFGKLVDSGFAFSAERWVVTLEKQCDYVDATLRNSQVPGNRSLLCLTHRMSRSFSTMLNTSAGNNWLPMPVTNAENIFVRTDYNDDDQGTPRGVIVTVATSIKLPVLPENLFDFLRCFCCRPKWDLLSSDCKIEGKTRISTGREHPNFVSMVLSEHEQRKRIPICYLEDSYTDAVGHYIVYAPIDIPTMNAIMQGATDPDRVAILPSGFAILPDEVKNGEEGSKGWSILTAAFQMPDQNASSPECIPPQSVATLYNLITRTATMIRNSFGAS